MLSAAGLDGKSGIVIILPASATINPAPLEILSSRIVIEKFSGLPNIVGSSVKEY